MFTTKNLGRAALLGIASGTVLAASFAGAGAAQAAPAHARGFSPVESCTGLTGAISFSPGLVKTKLKTEHAVFTGTLSGCSGEGNVQDGTGTVTAILSGSSKVSSIVESGTVTVNWPASSGLNPSNGTLTLRRAATDLPYTVYGSVTSGAFTGSVLSSGLVVTGHTGSGTSTHPIVQQTVTNTDPFAAKVNFG